MIGRSIRRLLPIQNTGAAERILPDRCLDATRSTIYVELEDDGRTHSFPFSFGLPRVERGRAHARLGLWLAYPIGRQFSLDSTHATGTVLLRGPRRAGKRTRGDCALRYSGPGPQQQQRRRRPAAAACGLVEGRAQRKGKWKSIDIQGRCGASGPSWAGRSIFGHWDEQSNDAPSYVCMSSCVLIGRPPNPYRSNRSR